MIGQNYMDTDDCVRKQDGPKDKATRPLDTP